MKKTIIAYSLSALCVFVVPLIIWMQGDTPVSRAHIIEAEGLGITFYVLGHWAKPSVQVIGLGRSLAYAVFVLLLLLCMLINNASA